MAEHLETGDRGEDLAAAFLETNGWKIVARNVRYTIGEIDLVAQRTVQHGFGVATMIAFVEVKTRRSARDRTASERAVTRGKREKVIRASKLYLNHHPVDSAVCRFDVVAVDLSDTKPRVTHYPNAFDANARITR